MTQIPLYLPWMASFYASISDIAYALARIVAGLAMVPHGLRATFGFFAGSGRVAGFKQTVEVLDKGGFRPAQLWSVLLTLTHFVAGPLLALGFLTRPAALACFVMLLVASFDRWRVGGYFANRQGLEFPMVWAALVLIFIAFGAGRYSIDWLVIGREF